MDRDLREHLELLERNQVGIHQDIEKTRNDVAEMHQQVVAILRGIEDELKRRRR
jgi:hypothetical protein